MLLMSPSPAQSRSSRLGVLNKREVDESRGISIKNLKKSKKKTKKDMTLKGIGWLRGSVNSCSPFKVSGLIADQVNREKESHCL